MAVAYDSANVYDRAAVTYDGASTAVTHATSIATVAAAANSSPTGTPAAVSVPLVGKS